jgi:methanogenic corrinoid protein MtbC1
MRARPLAADGTIHAAARAAVLDLVDVREKYVAAQCRGDRRAALRVVVEEGLERGASVDQLQLEVLQEAQREIGRRWELGAISVAQEHMATAISHVVLAHLYDRAPAVRPNGRRILIACVQGELHDFPARLLADGLDLAGFEVRYLGADVPTSDLVREVAETKPDLVGLSVTMVSNLPALRGAVAELRQAHPSVAIAIGGSASVIQPATVAALSPVATGRDAREFVVAAQRALGVET